MFRRIGRCDLAHGAKQRLCEDSGWGALSQLASIGGKLAARERASLVRIVDFRVPAVPGREDSQAKQRYASADRVFGVLWTAELIAPLCA